MSAEAAVADRPHPVVDELAALLGDRLHADQATRDYYANDVFWQPGIRPLAVACPASAAEAAGTVAAAARHGVAIVPRGGGMSYTKGYLPALEEAIVVDARGLDRVVEVNAEDMYVTVEAGCTWAAVNAALEGTGLRTGYWGPLSGVNATVGGALSQNSAFFGSALNATVAESVLGVTAVLADGTVVTTGSGGRTAAKPFTRANGPDLTGLFLGDNGALGLKVAATLRLMPRPQEVGHLSFGFSRIEAMAAAQVALARERLVSEGFGIDRNKAAHSASVNRISDGLKVLADVARSGGIRAAAGVAAGGAAFLREHAFTLHLVLEGRSRDALEASLARARALCAAEDGVELEPTVPKVMRARPFGPVRGMLGADGERWVPVHAVFPLGEFRRVLAENDAFFEAERPFMERHGILYSVMTMTVGTEFFLEPAFYWTDEITPLHARSLGEDVVKPWRDRPANPEARAAVADLRRRTQELYARLGGVSWQVARDYPFRTELAPETFGLLEAVKRALDPAGRMNPGALDLAVPDAASDR